MQRSLLALVVVLTTSSAKAAPSRLSVLTANVQFDSTADADSLALIARAAADVVCVQELTPRFAGTFERALGKTYPHRLFQPASGTWGIGLASRLPLEQRQVFAQAPHRMPAASAVVRTEAGPLTVVCLHLFPPGAKRVAGEGLLQAMHENAALRVQQARGLVTRFAGTKGALVLLGDFNEAASDDALGVFRSDHFALACDAPGASCGATWPARGTLVPAFTQIDHVLGRGVRFTSAKVLHGGGSDHHPVQAALELGAAAK